MSVVVVDSDVMFDANRRYLLLSLAFDGLLTIRWSDSLLREWTDVIVREGVVTPVQGQHQYNKLRADFPQANVVVSPAAVTAAAPFVKDAGDEHVAACALAVAPCTLLTFNTRDFDVATLAIFGVDVRKPGPWLAAQFDALAPLEQRDWARAMDAHRRSLRDPAMSRDEYLALMREPARALVAFTTRIDQHLRALP